LFPDAKTPNILKLWGSYSLIIKLRHFLFTWLKKQNIDDALIQPYSGHAKRDSLEIYSKLSLADAQDKYNDVIGDFPI
jgi:integrase/recombinase XerD